MDKLEGSSKVVTDAIIHYKKLIRIIKIKFNLTSINLSIYERDNEVVQISAAPLY